MSEWTCTECRYEDGSEDSYPCEDCYDGSMFESRKGIREGMVSRMERIEIKKNSLGDTRTATRVPTFAEFSNANRMHVADVANMMRSISEEIRSRGWQHDITKIDEPNKSVFYRELCAKIEGKIDSFTDGEWYPIHCQTERHHLNEHCPDDVNLIDVIEMICDCVCAGMARSGIVYPVEIPSEILQKAIVNTVQMCIDSVDVKDGENHGD